MIAGRAEQFRWLGEEVSPVAEPWYRFRRVLESLEDNVEIPVATEWVDVGCHLGQFIDYLSHFHCVQALGIDDYQPDQIERLAATYAQASPQQAKELAARSWTYAQRRLDVEGIRSNQKFDFVSALEVIEHMIDTDAFIEDCKGHLSPGGVLIVSTPNINSLRNRVMVPIGRYPAGMEYRNIIHHVRMYNVPALLEQMSAHGLIVVSVRGVNFLPMRFVRGRFWQYIDNCLARLFPTLCGNIIAIFRLGVSR